MSRQSLAMKALYAARRARGECTRCGVPAYGASLCQRHARDALRKTQAWRYRARERYHVRRRITLG
jgi:hypothetical protein